MEVFRPFGRERPVRLGYDDRAVGPLKGDVMGFGEAISSGFSSYVNFSARAARSEFWYWTLFVFLLAIVANIVDALVVGFGSGVAPVSALVSLGLLLPN